MSNGDALPATLGFTAHSLKPAHSWGIATFYTWFQSTEMRMHCEEEHKAEATP